MRTLADVLNAFLWFLVVMLALLAALVASQVGARVTAWAAAAVMVMAAVKLWRAVNVSGVDTGGANPPVS